MEKKPIWKVLRPHETMRERLSKIGQRAQGARLSLLSARDGRYVTEELLETGFDVIGIKIA
jgi:hypothetical protein